MYRKMDGRWGSNPAKLLTALLVALMVLLFHQNLSFCMSLNAEGLALLKIRERIEEDPFGALSDWNEKTGNTDPCFWFGVECSDGNVVSLHLQDLCLHGTLEPEFGRLTYLKSLILRNNSFYGNIPEDIKELKDLELLDLGYNNFTGKFPLEFADNLSLKTLLLDNNNFLGSISPELLQLKMHSEIQADENQLRASCSNRHNSWNRVQAAHRLLLQVAEEAADPPRSHHRNIHHSGSSNSRFLLPPSFAPSETPASPSLPPSDPIFLSPLSSFSPWQSPSESPSFSPSESPSGLPLSPSPTPTEAPTQASPIPVFSPPQHLVDPMIPATSPSQSSHDNFKSKNQMVLIAGIVGGSFFLLISAASALFFRSSKVVTVKPWATGLSGQLQKAFITGVPKLKRSELEAACEDFSNIIGFFSNGTVYKGTLSSGVEIAVTSTAVKSRKEWSKNSEANFRKKIDTLSKMNHKNFVNLIGYCEEDEPFTRIMVFEYAPNGTLFEHLHVKEAEHLDWGMRLRIAMGVAYCLEYMHQLSPPLIHDNLQSSAIYLTEDYAAKISDFSLWNDITATKMGSESMQLVKPSTPDRESNIYSFGVILYEMITGRTPYDVDKDSIGDVTGRKAMREMVDPTLNSFKEDELEKLISLIKTCMDPDTKQRPTMSEIVSKLKEITAMGPDGATPKLSPLWWAELEILSTEES